MKPTFRREIGGALLALGAFSLPTAPLALYISWVGTALSPASRQAVHILAGLGLLVSLTCLLAGWRLLRRT